MNQITRHADWSHDLFTQMRREMDQAFQQWFGRAPALAGRPSTPELFAPCDVQETDQEYLARFDVPGMTAADIKVSFQGDALTVSGERKNEKTEGKGSTRFTERSYGSFARTITLPAPIKAEEIRARYKDGVMEVHLPKAQKTSTREIKVEAGT
jgi:HSP20 family protein